MNRQGISRGQIFLVELILMILFFSVTAAVLLQVFFKAREYSMDSALLSKAIIAAESTADRTLALPLSDAKNSGDVVYLDENWNAADESSSAYELHVQWTEEPAAGQLTGLTITVLSSETGDAIYTLETKKYYSANEGGAV